MYERKIPLAIGCGLHLTKEVLNGKWKPALLSIISLEVKRPSQILRRLPDATRRVLTVQLNELEEHGIIEKKVYSQLPPKVEYSLTQIGWSLMPIIDALNQWGDTHREFLETVITRNSKNAHITKSACQVHLSLAARQKSEPVAAT